MSHVEQNNSVEISNSSLRRKNLLRIAGLCLLGVLLALGALNSKILGAAWLAFWVWGLWVAFKTRGTASKTETLASAAASIWLVSCIAALTLAITSTLIWPENAETLNAYLRLVLPAAAALALLRRGGLSEHVRIGMLHAITAACIIAFTWTAFNTMQVGIEAARFSLATNPIPWAAAISFYSCLLLPIALAENQSALKRRIWLLGAACGIGAVILSASRGAFLIIPWCGLVFAWFWHHRKYSSHIGFYRTLLLLSCAVAVFLAGAWWGPGDVLRMRQAAQNITSFETAANYNTSVGARLYLWGLAWKGIQESPLIGIGGAERLRRIKQAGDSESKENLTKFNEIHSLGHVHNQYLHSVWDGGMIGLTALLVLLAGMAIATRRLARIDPVAAWQLGGVLFMHATSNLTNVNFAHNYYALALSLAAVIPLLAARNEPPT